MHLSAADIEAEGAVLATRWSDGTRRRFHAIWLRDNALDPDTRDAGNGQRLITLADVPEDTRLARVAIVDDGLDVVFAPEDKAVRYASDWLAANVYDRAATRSPGWTPADVTTWDAALAPPSFSHKAVETDPIARRDWLAAIRRFGFAKMTGGAATDGALFKVIDLFGYVRETNYGRHFEVRSEVNPTNLAYTGLGLQAHTDNPYSDPA
ncbi:MAG: gamma-butyrobetaine hydroxylase-like domain-containing protein, partial [Pseudomonadota bacterium]